MTVHDHDEHERDLYDLGLTADLTMWMQTPVDRRRILKLGKLGMLGVGTFLAGCRTSLGTKATAAGVPFTFELTLVNTNKDCAPLANYAIYTWHCNREGNYSLYSSGVTDQDYLRGVQATGSDGKATFVSIFPACYSGRWPHVHFEVYPSLEKATAVSNVIRISQFAMPEAACKAVFATDGYSASVQNLSQVTLATDNVFSDGVTAQLPTLTGDVTTGYTAKLVVGIAV